MAILIGLLGMSEPSTPLLALALDSAAFDPAERDAAPGARVDPAAWLKLVLAAERHGISLVTLADTHRAADGVPRLDALMLAAFLGARTRRIGIVAAGDTTLTEPYLLASQVATTDFVSAGRAGWLAQVSGRPEDAGYVGPRSAAVGEAAWNEAAEFIEVVRSLWDSWEDDAEIRDVTHHRFIDRERIHHIDFVGEHLAVKGPSITPRSPQGQPPVAVEVGDGRSLELALSQGDVVFLGDGGDPTSVRTAAAERGRELRLFLDRDLTTVSAEDLRAALADGFDGVRLVLTTRSGQLVERLDELALRPRPAVLPGSLRDQLGLPRPLSRYARALSETIASGAGR